MSRYKTIDLSLYLRDGETLASVKPLTLYMRKRRLELPDENKRLSKEWRERQSPERIEQLREASRQWRKDNSERFKRLTRSWHLKDRYGVSQEWYTGKHKEQKGLCAICGKSETGTSSKGESIPLSVDHDHETGKVRDLLCRTCNKALAWIENEEWRLKAEAYVAKHKI